MIITETGMPSVGEIYTLTCNVSTAPGVSGITRVEWLGPGVDVEGVTIGDTVAGEMVFTKRLTFSPLMYSEDYVGQYTCRATIMGQVKENFQIVHVIRKSIFEFSFLILVYDCIASTHKYLLIFACSTKSYCSCHP